MTSQVHGVCLQVSSDSGTGTSGCILVTTLTSHQVRLVKWYKLLIMSGMLESVSIGGFFQSTLTYADTLSTQITNHAIWTGFLILYLFSLPLWPYRPSFMAAGSSLPMTDAQRDNNITEFCGRRCFPANDRCRNNCKNEECIRMPYG